MSPIRVARRNPPDPDRSKGNGLSTAIWTAHPPASLAQLARARDL